MKINDIIYGEFEISEPVLLELLECPSVLRLRKIAQAAVPREYYQFPGYSRYEHSVGVMLLLRKLGAGLEEQVTGLLHDVSHTAFSHLIDHVLHGEGGQEDYQDNRHESVIKNSEIPAILAKHGLSVERISSHKLDSLLEKEIPDLCADRVDYGLREIYYSVNPDVVKECVANLTVADNGIVFKSKPSALIFATHFLARQRDHWGAPEPMLRWDIFAKMLRYAITKNIIDLSDFDRDDEYVMDRLKKAGDQNIMSTLEKLKSRLHFSLTTDKEGPVFKKKFRFVDPLFIENGRLSRLSENDPGFAEFLEAEKAKNKIGVGLIYQ